MQRFDAAQLKTRQLSHNRIVFADFLSDLTNGNANIARINLFTKINNFLKEQLHPAERPVPVVPKKGRKK